MSKLSDSSKEIAVFPKDVKMSEILPGKEPSKAHLVTGKIKIILQCKSRQVFHN